jgi:hypothetical protein
VRGGLFGRKVALLPEQGTLIVATDLQGNLADYVRLKSIYAELEEAGREPFLLICGDLVHGPDESIARPVDWPDYLGAYYKDRSAELVLDYEQFAASARTLCLLGNHEHAHIGGPVVSKFHEDEAAVLEARLGPALTLRVRAFLESFPLIAVSRCGAVFTHAAPRATEASLEAFERLRYRGYQSFSIHEMYAVDTVGALLWSRGASPAEARALLAATALDGQPGAFVAYGHDVVREGYEKIGAEQICVSSSYGLEDGNKVYLRLDLAGRYGSVADLREGDEILPLYPELG